jgi:hypothetical protein
MPIPSATFPAAGPIPAGAFVERLLRVLIPLFTGVSQDLVAARAEVLETLAAYGARTRAELLFAARIIAFSFAALDTLAEAAAPDLSPSMRLRFRGCANNLNRSGQKIEQALAKHLANAPPDAVDPQADIINDCPGPEADAILEQTLAEIDAHRSRAAAGRPTASQSAAANPVTGQGAAPADSAADYPTANNPAAGRPAPAAAAAVHPIDTGHPAASQPITQRPAITHPTTNHPAAHVPQQRPLTQQEQTNRLWGAAMINVLAEMGLPVKLVSGAEPSPGTSRRQHR